MDKEIKQIRILVVSISAWNSKVGMNTWPTLLERCEPSNIANISLREDIPDSKVCNHYFSISENRVIKSIFNKKIKTGYVTHINYVNDSALQDLEEQKQRYAKMKKKRNFFMLMARELVWVLGSWKTKELRNFVLEFKPDIVLYSMDGYIHMNRICRYICKIAKAKSIGFFADDNFTYKQSRKLGNLAFRFFQRKSLKKLVKHTDAFWAISELTKQEADNIFEINSILLTKPLYKQPCYIPQKVECPLKVLYTGNLQIGRDRSLVKFVNAIRIINQEKTRIKVDVYTNTVLDKEIQKKLNFDFCKIHEPVAQSEVFDLQSNADILLFLEDIDGENAKTARLSFSTKITDYLASAKCIFALGCLDTAPMQYFINNDAAIVATTEESIILELNNILEHLDLVNQYAKKACECGIRNHNKDKILDIFENTIKNLVYNSEVKDENITNKCHLWFWKHRTDS